MSYTIERQVGVCQTDGNGRLSLVSALDNVIDCVVFELDSFGEFSRYLKEHGLGMFQVHTQVDIYRRPRYGEKIQTTTNVYECSGIRGYRNTLVRDGKGEVCVATYSSGAFVNRLTGRPAKLPAEAIAMLDMKERYDMEYLPAKIELPENAEWVKAPVFSASDCDLDMNGHVTSNRYVLFAEKQLPRDFFFDRVRVEYRHQTKPGEEISIESCRVGDAIYVRINNEAGESKAVVSFSTR